VDPFLWVEVVVHAVVRCVGGPLCRVVEASAEQVDPLNTGPEGPRATGEVPAGLVAHTRAVGLREDPDCGAVVPEGLLWTSSVLGHARVEVVPVAEVVVRIAAAVVEMVQVVEVLVRIAAAVVEVVPVGEVLVRIVAAEVVEVQVAGVFVHIAVAVAPVDLVPAWPEQLAAAHPFFAYRVAVEHRVDRWDPDVAVSSLRRVPGGLELRALNLDSEQNS